MLTATKTVRDQPLTVGAHLILKTTHPGRSRGRESIDWRRAVVRAAAREIIAEEGVEGLHMRYLADRCSMATQTLYNNFGSREIILHSAIEEHTRANLMRVWEEAAESGANAIFLAADLTTRLVKADFNFMRQLLGFFERNETTHPLVEASIRLSDQSHFRALKMMQASNALRSWVDCDLAAGAVKRVMLGMLNGLIRHDDDPVKRAAAGREYRMAIGTFLLGITCGPEADRLEQLLTNSEGRNISHGTA